MRTYPSLFVSLLFLLASCQVADPHGHFDGAPADDDPLPGDRPPVAGDRDGTLGADPGDRPGDPGDPSDPEAGPRWEPVHSVQTTPLFGSVHTDVGEDGSIYVIWMEDSGEGSDVWLSRSLDGGDSFEAAVRVDGDEIDPLLAWANQPYVLVAEDRVHVTMMANDPMRIFMYSALVDGDLQFDPPVHVAADAPSNHRPAYARAALGPDGDVWVGYNVAIRHSQWDWDHSMGFARESTGFAATQVPVDDPPCDCCPSTLMAASSGDMILGFRSHTAVGREIKVAISPDGSEDFPEVHAVSGEPWYEEVCPNQGPWLAELSDGTLLLTTADASQGSYMAWLSRSEDGGQTWGEETRMNPPESIAGRPTIAVDSLDRVWATYQTSALDSALVHSDDGGATFSAEQALVSPDGVIASAVVASRGDVTVIAGVTAEGEVWMFQP